MKSHKRLFQVSFGLYLIVILWITLFSRVGESRRDFLPLFWSYKEIFLGNIKTLNEDINNVLLFVPFGIVCGIATGWKRRYVIVTGFLFATLIESGQWLLKLGTSEMDDIINNTIGVLIGLLLANGENRKSIIAGLIIIIFFIVLPPTLQTKRKLQMKELASLHDRADGSKNLLILDGNPGKTFSGDIFISYNDDGSITISGASDVRSWKMIGEIILESGNYVFTGLSGVKKNTIAIELEYFDKRNNIYVRLTPDVGPVDEARFMIKEKTKIRAYVSVYPGVEGVYIALPAIYRED